MKSVTRAIHASITGLILTAALATSAAAQREVPFGGKIQGNDSDNFISPTTLVVTSTGMGNATHLGRFTFTLLLTVDLTQGTDTGSAEFTAANGDRIFATIVGSSAPTDNPDLIRITETYTITGGTGRFTGAQGSFLMQRIGNGALFITYGSFDGAITPPGAVK